VHPEVVIFLDPGIYFFIGIIQRKDKNQFMFKHSSQNDPLKDSMSGFSVGLPGRE